MPCWMNPLYKRLYDKSNGMVCKSKCRFDGMVSDYYIIKTIITFYNEKGIRHDNQLNIPSQYSSTWYFFDATLDFM